MSSYFEQFKNLIARGDFLILDTETTGLHDGEICQIAVIDDRGTILLDSYVKPQRGIPADAFRIHRISDDHVANAPSWPEIAEQLKSLLLGRDLVVYNAVYDRKMMHRSAEHAGIEKVEWKEIARWWCAMEAYAEHYGEWNDYHGNYRWQRLSFAASQCGVTVENAHSALGDCLMTLGVVKAMLS